MLSAGVKGLAVLHWRPVSQCGEAGRIAVPMMSITRP
jgi:hypothetical protein